jgi:DNA adenine methylase
MTKTKPILRWPGGKRRLLPKILPLITPHVCYVESFAGGLAVLLAKERSNTEVINDINGDLIALYRNVQYHLPELLREIDFALGSRKGLKDFMAQPGLTEIQRAARFLIRNKTSFGGNMDSFAVSRKNGGGGFSRESNTALLGEAHKRLDRVTIESLPYERCMDLYDSKDTFHFFDPPYLGSKIKAYDGWTEAQMCAFRKRLDKLQGNWVLTVDGSDFNRELFKDFRIEAVSSKNQSVNVRTHGEQRFKEFIITPK